MSTLTASLPVSISPAHVWFEQHLPELRSRARVFVRRFPPGERPDAVPEILGQTWRYVLGAARRGKLAVLMPFTLVQFFGSSYAAGRRLCGARITDALSGCKHRPRVFSLDQPCVVRAPDGLRRLPLSEVLADRRVASPLELVRQNLDYPAILRRQKASRRVRRVFAYLAQTHGAGRQTELARALGVSPPRVVRFKRQLARCLAAGGDGRLRQRRGA